MSNKKTRRKAAKAAQADGQAGALSASTGAEESARPASQTRLLYPALAILAAVITFIVYLPTLSNYFLAWDDTVLILSNRAIRKLDIGLIEAAFGDTFMAAWMPLTIISFAVDHALWGGLKPEGFHLTNNILHSLNAILVFVVTSQAVSIVMKRRANAGGEDGAPRAEVLAISFVAALLFSLHPLRVESVAWATERKDVLFLFFYLLAIACYLKYVVNETRKMAFFALSVVFAAFSMMSKPMAATLPMVLVLLDFYPLGRAAHAWQRPTGRLSALSRLALEKAPFFFLALALTVITVVSHVVTETIVEGDISATLAPFLVARNAGLLLLKMIFPAKLIPYYYFPSPKEVFMAAQAPYYIVFIAVTAFALMTVKKRGYILAIWLFYIITSLPISIWTAGADRFTYLPGLGPTILAALPAALVVRRASAWRRALTVAVFAVVFAVSIFLTVRHIRVWKDTVTLWTHQIKNAGHKHERAYNNMGYAYALSGDNREALELFTQSIKANPAFTMAYMNRAKLFALEGDLRGALADYARVVDINDGPSVPAAHMRSGEIFEKEGEYDRALDEYSKAIEKGPRLPTAYFSRALFYAHMEKASEAEADYLKAIELDSKYREAHLNLANLYGRKKDFTGAIEQYTKALEIAPGYRTAYLNRAKVFDATGETQKAISDLKKIVELYPRDIEAYQALGVAYDKAGMSEEAEVVRKKASEIGQ